MYKELNNLTVTTGKRAYRTEENRPNRERLFAALKTAGSMDDMETLCREFLHVTRINDIIDRHENLIEKCMEIIVKETESGMIITKEHMADYLHKEHNIVGDRTFYGYTDPRGATEYALERLVEKGYLKKVKVRHTQDGYFWHASSLDAYEVI